MDEFELVDEFDAMKARVRELKATVPSQKGCLKALAEQGVTGPMVQAAVEAVFHEDKEAARERRQVEELGADGGDRTGTRLVAWVPGVLWLIAIVVVGVVGGSMMTAWVSPDAGLLSPLHIMWMVGVGGFLKVVQGWYRAYS